MLEIQNARKTSSLFFFIGTGICGWKRHSRQSFRFSHCDQLWSPQQHGCRLELPSHRIHCVLQTIILGVLHRKLFQSFLQGSNRLQSADAGKFWMLLFKLPPYLHTSSIETELKTDFETFVQSYMLSLTSTSDASSPVETMEWAKMYLFSNSYCLLFDNAMQDEMKESARIQENKWQWIPRSVRSVRTLLFDLLFIVR